MNVAALVVAIVSAAAAVVAVLYARRSDKSAARSAEAAERAAAASETQAALEGQRRQTELTPRFRVSFNRMDGLLTVRLVGPLELERLDSLTVKVRDDNPWRSQAEPRAGGPSPEEVAAQVWGPYRFIPGTGPGASVTRGVPGADSTGRVTPTRGMPVGEALTFAMEATRPPKWWGRGLDAWRRDQGRTIRLQLECRRNGWEPWSLPCEVDCVSMDEIEVP